MAFIPPLNLGQFQPSPATLSQWVYQIWQFLQENPIATEEEIRTYIESELTESTTLSTAIEDYLTENPPDAPVQSVQGKTGAVTLAYNDIVTSSNTIPVYKASSTPSASTLVGQYNLGYRLFVNTATQEIYTISPAGALSLVGRGKFDGTTIDVNTSQGDTTISEAVTEINSSISAIGTTDYLLEWGRYTSGNVYNLSHPFTDYDYFFVYTSSSTDQNSGGTHQFYFIKPAIGEQMGLTYLDNGHLFNIRFQFDSETTVNYISLYDYTTGALSTSNNGIRGIVGIRL